MPVPAHIAQRLNEQHRQTLAKPLSDRAVSGIRALSMGPLKPALPQGTVNELVAAGYAREAFGGVMLTDAGIIRAMQES